MSNILKVLENKARDNSIRDYISKIDKVLNRREEKITHETKVAELDREISNIKKDIKNLKD